MVTGLGKVLTSIEIPIIHCSFPLARIEKVTHKWVTSDLMAVSLAITTVLFFMMVPYLLSPICSRCGKSCSSVSFSRLSVLPRRLLMRLPLMSVCSGRDLWLAIEKFFA